MSLLMFESWVIRVKHGYFLLLAGCIPNVAKRSIWN